MMCSALVFLIFPIFNRRKGTVNWSIKKHDVMMDYAATTLVIDQSRAMSISALSSAKNK